MSRVFTMRKCCRACGDWFTITSAASMFCKGGACVKDRRRQARLRAKPAAPEGSDGHLERAIKSGE